MWTKRLLRGTRRRGAKTSTIDPTCLVLKDKGHTHGLHHLCGTPLLIVAISMNSLASVPLCKRTGSWKRLARRSINGGICFTCTRIRGSVSLIPSCAGYSCGVTPVLGSFLWDYRSRRDGILSDAHHSHGLRFFLSFTCVSPGALDSITK